MMPPKIPSIRWLAIGQGHTYYHYSLHTLLVKFYIIIIIIIIIICGLVHVCMVPERAGMFGLPSVGEGLLGQDWALVQIRSAIN